MNKHEPYEFLEEVLHKINSIENTLKVLNHSTLSIEDKIEQMGLLEEIRYEIISHDLIKESLINASNKKNSTNSWQLKLIENVHKNYSVLPLSLVKALSKTKIECFNLWKLSHSEASNLTKLKECFTDLTKLICEVASIRSQQLKCSKYDSVLALDMTEKDIKEIFPKIGSFFSQNIDKITEKQSKQKIINVQNVSIEKQVNLNSAYLQHVGINMDEICTYYDYVNSSIDYDESSFCCGLFSLLRCSSNVIYQKHLSQSGQIATGIVNETQKLLIEKILGTSREFIEFLQPHIKEKFAIKTRDKAKASSIENLYLIFNKVNLSSSFKKADESTLLAHIMLRTKLEQDLIDGRLEVKDLHDAWLEGMKHYKIPVNAKNELETYFQDEYWASGIIGYFPMKMVALIAAAQIFSFIKQNHSECLSAVGKGDFSLFINWLSENVYNARCGILEMLKKVTGKNLDIECYTNYLSEKYSLCDE